MTKEHPGVPGGGALRAKEAMEWIMQTVFLVCGFIAVAFVLLITVYLIISGLPAIREVGLTDFLFGTTLGLHRQDRPRLWHPPLYPHLYLRHRRGHPHRGAHRLPHRRLSGQGGAPQGGRRHPPGSGSAGGHPLGGLRPGGHDGPAAPPSVKPLTSARRRQPAGRHHRAGSDDPALHHLGVRDRPECGAPGV